VCNAPQLAVFAKKLTTLVGEQHQLEGEEHQLDSEKH